jgi:hypothetical protein
MNRYYRKWHKTKIRRFLISGAKMVAGQTGEPSACAAGRMANYLQANFRRHLDETVSVRISHKNVLAPVATAHHMMPGSGIFHSSLPWQGSSPSPASPSHLSKTERQTIH